MNVLSICWWNVASWLVTGLLTFTVGLIVGAFFAIGVLVFLWLWIALAVLWSVLLVIIRVLFYMRCRSCFEET